MERRTVLKAGLVAPAAVTGSALAAAPADARPRLGGTLATGLDYPWGLDFLPGGGALVSERNSGRVLHVRPGGGATVAGVVPDVHNDGGEGGLMGVAVSPTFSRDRWVYFFLTTPSDNRIVRIRYVDGRLSGAPHPILTGIPSDSTHNGGGLWFTSYPSLFATTGDTRNSALAQNKGSLAGKVLRLKPDGTAQRGNPFGNRVYSFGHRNVEGITVDASGRLWASELGENTWDELNRILPGRNYGWPRVEGTDRAGGFRDPLVQWHPADCSPSGVTTLHGRAWVGALRGECLWSVDIDGRGLRRKTRYFHGTFGRIRNVKRAPDGSLWLTTSNGGGTDKVLRVTFG
ncbi:PQQ-dependent sugar dehydrogenase [Nocardioides panacis]|uniref:PQQ-dependent sugar dehydrogenase n=1 Tax=Nocardioides panacis TaxID=2849501 RepID=A0A975Y062_9ACTN|nr:PQQ-dependent sugar dehydrogenase [Nocardioides panacis]QWZ07999.1 PQQ-dependent sugar dehydrogenase [Nocardioides panacis]